MKLVRQILAVLAVVGVTMALGFAWKHSPAASLVSDRGHAIQDPGRFPTPPGVTPDRTFDGRDRGRDGGFDLSRVDDLGQSLVILGLIIAAVVVVDRVRRQRSPVVSGSRSRP